MRGFTVVELMIATSVFSIILVVGATAFIGLGNTFFKGFTLTQTQETTKQIINNISSNIRLSASVDSTLHSTGLNNGYYICIGSHRYTFNQFQEVDTSNHDFQSNFGLIEDQPPTCGNPFIGAPAVPFVNPTELLGNNMRILNLTISSPTNNVYSVNLAVASGADTALTSNGQSAASQCQNQKTTNRFCAVSSLSTVVHQGVSV